MALGRAQLSPLLLAPGLCGQGGAEVEARGRSHALCDFRHHLSLFWSLASLFFRFCWSGDDVLGEMRPSLALPSCARTARGGFEQTPVKATVGLGVFLSKHLLDFSSELSCHAIKATYSTALGSFPHM